MKNAVSWFEIPTENLDRAKKFYETVFDISMHTLDIGDEVEMALFPADGNSVGGALVNYPSFYQPGSTGPLLYLNANPDLENVLQKVDTAGGEVLIKKRMISPENGFMAVIKDPEGNRVALHSLQ